MKFKNKFEKPWFAYTFAICCGVLFFWLLTNIGVFLKAIGIVGGFVWPVFLALIISYVMSPLVSLFENNVFKGIKKDGPRRYLSLFCAFLSIVLCITIVIVALIPQLIDSVATFVSNVSGYVGNFESLLENISNFMATYNLNINSIVESFTKFLQDFASSLPQKVVELGSHSMNAGKSLFNLFMACILSLYFLADAEKLLKGFKRLMHGMLRPDTYVKLGKLWHRCDKIMLNYIVCDLLDGVIVGVCTWIFMMIARIPYSVIIAVVVGVTNLAPTFGPIIGAVVGGFILVLVNPFQALIFLIFIFVIQTVDGYIIKPKLFGDSLGVSGLWILVGIIIGGRMFGVVGILLAIPMVAIIDFLYQDYFLVWLEDQKGPVPEIVIEEAKSPREKSVK